MTPLLFQIAHAKAIRNRRSAFCPSCFVSAYYIYYDGSVQQTILECQACNSKSIVEVDPNTNAYFIDKRFNDIVEDCIKHEIKKHDDASQVAKIT